MTLPIFRTLLTALCVTTLAGLSPAFAQLKLEGLTLDAAKQTWTLAPTGLPAQIVIKAEPAELPMPLRAVGAKAAEPDLQAIGRGPQLRSPIRLQALIGGQILVAQPAKPVQPVAADGGVNCVTELQAGALRGTLRLQYGADGAMTAEFTYGGQNVDVEKLELVLELAGACDTIIPGLPVAADGKAQPPAAYTLGTAEGIAWKNLPDNAEAKLPAYPGVLTHCFLGSGDRGFTWLAADATGFAVDAKLPTVLVERDKAGQLTWRLALVNTPTKMKDARTAKFALLVSPARAKVAGRRQAQWKPFAGVAATPALAWAGRPAALDLVRADCATVHEAHAVRALLAGPAGGDALTAAATLADAYPMPLFRYLAAPQTGLTAQLRTNAAALAGPGASPACDRMALGRALLHDIGVDVSGLGHRAAVANLLRALDAFGYFKDDGKTEFLPYWRAGASVRYGEAFTKGGTFEVTEENPVARAYVSVYLRPAAKDPSKTQALFVVVNESDKPLREQFYLLQPQRLFGGGNVLSAGAIIEGWDFSRIPEDSDWRKGVMIGSAGNREKPHLFLRDVEDDGFMQASSTGGGMEIYGKLFIPARGFRVLFGSGAP